MFTASESEQGDEWQRPSHVLVVDVGSGEFKPFLAEISPFGPPCHIEVAGLDKDKGGVRCSFLDINSHSRMLSDGTLAFSPFSSV
jgi:hypothetical protein